MRGLGIYVHLAFCPYICPYCDFAKEPYRRSAALRYLGALCGEIGREPVQAAATIFLGGGTPNAYDRQTIAQLLATLHARFPPENERREVTIELNPDLVRDGDFDAYRAAGVTRVSLGVQSLDEGELGTLGRRHSGRDVARAVASARTAGIESVSVDLIFAVPGQTRHSWQDTLARAIALEVDHISVYGLQVEEDTPFWDWQQREPEAFFDDRAEAELYDVAIEKLERSGYEQYEISNFARPGHRCAHNENYWNNGEYLGFGAGAASYRDGVRSCHTRSIEAYVAAASSANPVPGESEHLEGERRAGEAIMLALRTAQGVPLAAFKERYRVDVLKNYARVVDRYERAGLLEMSGDAVRLTRRGRFVANDVCAAFLASPTA
jgi:oxygen-independent coproporphyrinogen III oxidase